MQQDKTSFKNLLLFYPNLDKCSFQFFMDDKNKKDITKSKIAPVRTLIDEKTEDKAWERLKYLNDNGCGIFFSINGMENNKRDKKSVTTINARACECDHMDKELQMENINNCPLKPSMIIESKHSLHMYRFAKDGTKENWNKICRGLKNYFGGDPAIASDISRVLRLPGFYNCKPKSKEDDNDTEDFFLCKILKIEPKYFTEEEMLRVYSDTTTDTERKERVERINQQVRNIILTTKEDEDFWRNAAEIDNQRMLELLSGTNYVKGESISFKRNANGTLQIKIDGTATGSWIDKQGKIGSYSGGGPTWIQWIKWYWGNNIDWKELYSFLISNFPNLKPKKNIKMDNANISNLKIEEKKNDLKEGEKREIVHSDKHEAVEFSYSDNPITRGLEYVDDNWGRIGKGKYILFVGRAGDGKTEYCYFMARKNADAGIKTSFLTLEMDRKELLIRTAIKKAGITAHAWDNKTFSEQQDKIAKEEFERLKSHKNLSLFGIDNKTIEGVIETIRQEYLEGTQLLFIDNLGIIVNSMQGTEFDLQGKISVALMNLVRTIPITIVLIHHTKKMNGMRLDGQSQVKGNSQLNNDADAIVRITRDDDITTLHNDKNRFWSAGYDIELLFEKGDYVPLLEKEKEKEKEKKVGYPF